MRRFTLLILSTMLVVTAIAQRPESTVYKASVAPVIDGEVDDVWSEAEGPLDIAVVGSDVPPTLGDPGETTWQALWTDDGLYVLLRVEDDVFYPSYITGGESWQHDKPELYIDANFFLEDGIGPMGKEGHYQVAPAFEEGLLDGSLLTCGFYGEPGDIVEYAFNVADPTYIAEYFIPFESLLSAEGFAIDITEKVGFDVTILDREPDDAGERTAVWVNDGTNGSSWENMDDCGIIIFDGAQPGIYIDDISIEDGVITENNGTLQMEAAILPEEATNKTLTWTVQDGTGRAKIDAKGVVTGVIDGDVTVTGASTDGSFAEASATVTISNQIVTRPELNRIRNGYFDDVKEDNTPSEWNVPANTFINEEGVCVLAPEPGVDNNIWDSRLQQQGGWDLNTEDMYTLSMVLWADETDTMNLDFEDARADVEYNRYGKSLHLLAVGEESEWNFDSPIEPTKYIFDVQFVELIAGESNVVHEVQRPATIDIAAVHDQAT